MKLLFSKTLFGALLLSVGSLTAANAQSAQALLSQVKRTDLQQHDLRATGYEAVQVRVDFAPGVAAPKHNHPGEEIVYSLEGELEYQLDGQPPVVLKPGDVLFIPYGVNHAVKNVGTGNAAELATYIVQKGKPLVNLSK